MKNKVFSETIFCRMYLDGKGEVLSSTIDEVKCLECHLLIVFNDNA